MPSTNAQGRAEAEDKILASRPACSRGLNVTGSQYRRQYCLFDWVVVGEIRTLLSSSDLSRHASLSDRHVTLDDVITALRRLVLVAQCDVFGYISVENQLIVIISAVTDTPTDLQVIMVY